MKFVLILCSCSFIVAACSKDKPQPAPHKIVRGPLDGADITKLADGGAYLVTEHAVYYTLGSKVYLLIDSPKYIEADVTPLADGGAYIKLRDKLYYAQGTNLTLLTIDSSHTIAVAGSASKEKWLWALLQAKAKKLASTEADLEYERDERGSYSPEESDSYSSNSFNSIE